MNEKDRETINWAKKRIEQIDNEIENLIKEKRDLKTLCQNLYAQYNAPLKTESSINIYF